MTGRAYQVEPGTVEAIRRGEMPHHAQLGERAGAAGRDALVGAAADTVRQRIEGEATAAALVQTIVEGSVFGGATDGEELERAARGAERQPAAWRRGFFRRLQKALETV